MQQSPYHSFHPTARSPGLLLCLVLLASANLGAQTPALDEEAVKRVKSTLRQSGIEPTADGVARYLEDLHPNEETLDRLKNLIEELGNEDFYRREAAMKELLRLPASSPELFQEAIGTGDAEVRWRAVELLKQGNNRTDQMLHAAFQLIRHENLPDLLPLVIRAIPYCSETYIREEAVRTLKVITRPDDAPMLQAALQEKNPETQQIALETLEHVIGDDADPDLLPFLKAENKSIRLTAARALANHGHREALPVLVDLLAAEDLEVRAKAAATLRPLTGQNFSFVAYDTPARRAAARNEWVNWVANNADTAQLTFPIPDEAILKGHTLICNYTLKKVIELDANHKEVWSTELNGAWACQGLPNGHRLVTSYSQRLILEYDLDGKEVWRKGTLPGLPYSVERLNSGNTLVTCSNNQVLEYAPDGSEVWRKQFNGTPRDAQRLDNGNTLVVLYSTQEIVEVDRDGKEVWKLGNMSRPISAQRLPNGNTLVSQSAGARLVELDRKGNVVWSPNNITLSIYDAQRLPNGNTLLVGQNGATEIDPQGNTVWQLNQIGLRGIHRF
jgi:HEAT repeat protein